MLAVRVMQRAPHDEDVLMPMTEREPMPTRLRDLVTRFEALGPEVSRRAAISLLASAELHYDDVSPFVEESPHGYARRRIARTEAFEMLVMTWRPGQGSVPHDHAGSLCALRILRGRLHETRYAPAIDGLVDEVTAGDASETEVLVDASEHIHGLRNEVDARETLVTLHVYAPPLPELRRYALRAPDAPMAAVFRRSRAQGARTIAVIGGGFCGTMTTAHLLAHASAARVPLHVVLVDRQATFAEGPAYRTADGRHLLNVPASNMSAWPDKPTDFFDWAHARDARVTPTEFLPRRLYGEYVRTQFLEAAQRASAQVSAEVRRDDVSAVTRTQHHKWRLELSSGTLDADAVVLATGHRQPDDPLSRSWSGSRTRLVEDPWASLALSAIRADESVLLMGTGLTAVDVLLTLSKQPRTAPVIAVSRRGLAPEAHADVKSAPLDPREWLEPLLSQPGGPTAYALVRGLRGAAEAAGDWRAVVDGLRPYTVRLWQSLSPVEASRFVRHARPMWEVRRHRMAPSIARTIEGLRASGTLRLSAGRLIAARADDTGVSVDVRPRGACELETHRVQWVVNCTGPGSGPNLVPVVRSLVEGGHVEVDALGLGLRTGRDGRVLSQGRLRDDLIVAGTLRKPELWESTAVPELRQQAKQAATAALAHCFPEERSTQSA